MKTLIITAMLGDYSKVSEEIEKEFETKKEPAGPDTAECKSSDIKESEGVVSIHQFDMLSRSYDEKFNECELLKAENNELKKANIKLMETVNKYRYFIECQRNEIEKL